MAKRAGIVMRKAKDTGKVPPKPEKSETNGGDDCNETFEQINETQLLSYLREGWQVIHRLASGEIIVKR